MKKRKVLYPALFSLLFAGVVSLPTLTSCNNEQGGSEVVTKKVEVETDGNGTIELSKTEAEVGEEISIIVKPNVNFELETLTFNGTDIKASRKFTVVDGENKVKATFSKRKTAEDLFNDAMRADYTNATVFSYQQYENGEMYESDTSYLDNGYDLVYCESLAEQQGSKENAYLHYFVEKDVKSDATTAKDNYQSYMYFNKDTTIENSKGGWMQKGYKNSDLSVWNAYFYLPLFLDSIDFTDVTYTQGFYFIKETEKIAELNEDVFGYAWYNDIIDIAFSIDNNTGYVNKIFGYCDKDPNKEPENFVQIEISNVGSTVLPTDTVRYDNPTNENKTTYWQYKGRPNDYQQTYYKSANVKVSEGQDVTSDETHDVVLNLDQSVELGFTLNPDPSTLNPWDIIDQKNDEITWHYDPAIVELTTSPKTHHRYFRGMKEGECEVYVSFLGENDVTIESNHIKIKVNAAEVIDKTDAVYDFSFVTMDENRQIKALNNTASKAKFTITSGPRASVTSGKNSGLFSKDEMLYLVNPGESTSFGEDSKLDFNFGEQQVSSFEFGYGLYYASHLGNVSNIKSIVVNTYNGDTLSQTFDITNDIKDAISPDFVKIKGLTFNPANRVEVVFKANMLGKGISIGMNEFVFKANEQCQDYIDPSDTVDVTSITIAPSSLSMIVGETSKLVTLVEPTNATYQDVTYEVLTGSDVISIDNTGLVTALKAGSATLQAKDVTGKVTSNVVPVEVKEEPKIEASNYGTYLEENGAFSLKLEENKATVTIKSYSGDYTYEAQYASYEKKAEGVYFKFQNANQERVQFYFNEKNNIVCSDITYLKNGALTTLGSGLKDFYTGIRQVYAESISVTKVGNLTQNSNGEYEVTQNSTAYLYTKDIKVNPTTANAVTFGFESLNPEILSVSFEGGFDESGDYVDATYATIKFVGSGVGSLKVYSNENPQAYEVIKFNVASLVYPTEANFVLSSEGNKTEIEQGETLQMSATLLNDSEVNTSKEVTWSVENGSSVSYSGKIATITKNGLLSSKTDSGAFGEVVVKATIQGENGPITKQMTITIKEPSSSDVISPSTGLLGTWSGYDGNGTSFEVTITKDGKLLFSSVDLGIEYEAMYAANVSNNLYSFNVTTVGLTDSTFEVYLISENTIQISTNEDGTIYNNYDFSWYDGYLEASK